MSLGTSNRDGGKTSESGHLRALGKITSGDIIEGFNVTQRAAGLNMSVDVAIGDAFVRRSDGSYSHPVFNDAVYNQVISTADGSNPRRDIVVLYVDYGQAPSTAVSNNTNGVVKIKVVNGTPAGSPTDPSDVAIQSSVGSGNPWTKLARVRVPAAQASISNTLIDDLRVLIYAKTNSVPTAAIQDLAVTAAKLALGGVIPEKLDLTTVGIINTPSGSNFGSGAVDLASTSVVIPTGCTKVLVLGMVRMQSQNGSTQDISCWVDYEAATAVTKAAIYTSVGTTFAGSTSAIVDRITVAAGTRTFKLRGMTSSGGLANCGLASIFIIPIKG